ncbi:ATP synthase F1 subunit epsilon [Candidatus Uhrbacteria bacterium]|jgi:F-type H+-transporting ATPase subunit epsilon|nr:ATP synthase F1 subunit epsilon [Candidatus Uhrbacteria bacterium]
MADKTIQFSIVTPERIIMSQTVDSVSVMTSTGEITVLPNHAPLVSELKPGELKLIVDGKEELLAVSTGFIEVRDKGEVVILADTADRAEELDIEAINKAKEEAERIMSEATSVNDQAYAHAAAALEREMARHRVAMKRKR